MSTKPDQPSGGNKKALRRVGDCTGRFEPRGLAPDLGSRHSLWVPGVSTDVPVLLLAFNRPDAAQENLRRILKARPPRVYVAVDGPRDGVPADVGACAEVRRRITAVKTDIELHTDFAAQNLGLRARVVSALNWVFSLEQAVIILEDDCHPQPEFFGFMQDMLRRYEHDQRVGSVCGSTAVSLTRRGPAFEYDYHFTNVGLPWGWGTWARSWQDMDLELMPWPEMRRSGLLQRYVGEVAAGQWTQMLDHSESYSSWWVRWLVSQWAQSRLAVVPRASLVKNVGFGAGATHTHANTPYARFADIKVGQLSDTLVHPEYFPVDYGLDQMTLEALLPYSSIKRGLRQLAVEGPLSLRHHFR